MIPGLRFHHMGIATADLRKSLRWYEEVLGFPAASPIVADEGLRVEVVLVALPGIEKSYVELVGPLGETSPVGAYLKRGMSYYHACYEATDLPAAVTTLKSHGAVQIVPPTPAKLFDGRRVTFLVTRETGLIELLEAA